MCRFLIVKSKDKLDLKPLLSEFSAMCKRSKEWQGDGWGIAWKNKKLKIKNQKWNIKKYLAPIWEDTDKFSQIPASNLFLIHARSASFEKDKDNLNYNQPFVKNNLVFVFNGFLKGVKIKAEGEIGAEKMFYLVQKNLETLSLSENLERLRKILRKNTVKIRGFNVGLTDGEKIAVLCDYEENPDYFTIRYYSDENLTLICSEPLPIYRWNRMRRGEIRIFN